MREAGVKLPLISPWSWIRSLIVGEDLTRWSPILLQQMQKLPGLADVSSDQQNNGLQAALVYDRLTASRLGITPQMIDDTLYDAFGQRQVSTIYKALNQYFVVLEVALSLALLVVLLGAYVPA